MTAREIDVYDIPFSDLEKTVMAWVSEAIELRHGTGGDPEGRLRDADPEGALETMNLLRRVRARSDRVDGLLANAIAAKGRARRALAESEFAAENATATATTERASRRQEFEAFAERQADVRLQTIESRRATHQGKRLVDVTSEAYEQLNKISWQLSALRSDLRESIHAIQFESSLER